MSDVLDVYDAEVKANASAFYDICEKINPFLADLACLAEKGFCMLKDCIEKGLDLEKPNEEAVARHLFHIFHLMDSFRLSLNIRDLCVVVVPRMLATFIHTLH
ncbi:conserved domain protein [Trichinella spiralis]|uniref:hypothetical protein n=1 Tax=Trichinella spiralis TaxID=6334 RepID=UPI0001EFB356|nr:conserved domain protein [Trichinella spiralis]